MTCLLCFTSGLIKEKHPRPRFHRSHWSGPTAERDGRNSSLKNLQPKPSTCWRPPTTAGAPRVAPNFRTWMLVHSHCRVNMKKEEKEKKELLAEKTLSGMWFKYDFLCQSWLLLRGAIWVVVGTPSSIFGPSKHTPLTIVLSKPDRTALSCTELVKTWFYSFIEATCRL